MASIIILLCSSLFMMVVLSVFCVRMVQKYEKTMPLAQFQKNVLIFTSLAFLPLCLLLLLMCWQGPIGIFLAGLSPFPLAITLLCYRWKYPRTPKDIPSVGMLVFLAILTVGSISITGVCAYMIYAYVYTPRTLERLPPLVPPPVDYSLPP